MEVLAIVRFNSGIALVLNEPPKFKYNRYGNIIIGVDETGTFVKCYDYRDWGDWKAFAGHKFDIPLENGEVVHCDGKWWHGGHRQAEEVLGQKLVSATYQDIVSLKQCYVFTGDCAIKGKLDTLVSSYVGKIYEYREYEKVLKEGGGE